MGDLKTRTAFRCKTRNEMTAQQRACLDVGLDPTPFRYRQRTPPRATHIAGYCPPKGSIVEWFRGNVIGRQ